MSTLYTFNKQQFNADVSFNSKLHVDGSSAALGTNIARIVQGDGSYNSVTDAFQDPFSITTAISDASNLTIGMGVDTTSKVGYINVAQSGSLRPLFLNCSRESAPVIALGNVGIGTTNPGNKLEIAGYGADNSRIVINDTSVGTNFKKWGFGPYSGNLYGFIMNDDNTNNNNWLTVYRAENGTSINSVTFPNGNVGIGTTSPQRTLTVNGLINSREIRLVDNNQTIDISDNTTHMDVGTISDGHYLWGYGASKPLFFGTNQSEKMRISASGNVGIGTTSPAYTLDVNGLVRITGYGATYSSSPIANNIYGYLNAYSYNAELTSGTHNDYISVFVTYSIKTNAQIYAENFFGYSDKRIKNNIVDIDDEKALSILRQIKPKTYDYVDKVQRGNDSVIGFIAQEIKEIIPKAVTIVKDYVPSFYTNCQVSATDASNIVLVTSPIDLSWNALHDQSGNVFVDADGNACSDASGNKVFNVKLYDESNNEITCKTTNVLDKRSFLMDVSGSKMVDSSGNLQLESDGTYFLHGQEVDDFHNLDKSAIFTVVTAAVQDIDRKQVLDEAKIVALEAQVASQDARIAALEQAIAALLAK